MIYGPPGQSVHSVRSFNILLTYGSHRKLGSASTLHLLTLSFIVSNIMADEISTSRDTKAVLKSADSPFSPPPNEYATEKIHDKAETETIYLTGLRLKIVAVTYVTDWLIGHLTELPSTDFPSSCSSRIWKFQSSQPHS